MTGNGDNYLIDKKILYAGVKNVDFKEGTKVKFHYQTRKCNAEKTLLDDSHKLGKGEPMELILGKKFKLEVWEVLVQKMALKEVAQFTVNKSLVTQYPFVLKTIRDMNLKREERTHTCAMMLQTEGLGYDDLLDLLNNPCDLEFTMELLEVTQPEDYQKETWQMTENERVKRVPELREMGNAAYKEKRYAEAAGHYAQAIGLLEQFMVKEKPHDVEWNALNEQKLPFLLNFAQCKLLQGDFYAVIEHCTSVLQIDPNNVKALYRRGKAHIGAWNPDAAKSDLQQVIDLDPTLTATCKKELDQLEELIKQKNDIDKSKLKNLFSSSSSN